MRVLLAVLVRLFQVDAVYPEAERQVGDAEVRRDIVFIFNARVWKQVAVTGRIDNHLAEDSLAAGLAFDDNALTVVAFHDRLGTPGMAVHLDAGFFDHLIEDVLGNFGVDDGGVAYPVQPCHEEAALEIVPDELFVYRAPVPFWGKIHGVAGYEAVDPFLCKPDNLLFASIIGQQRDYCDQTPGAHASQVAVTFDEDGVRAVAGSRDCGANATRPAADDNDIRFTDYFSLSGAFFDSFHRNIFSHGNSS